MTRAERSGFTPRLARAEVAASLRQMLTRFRDEAAPTPRARFKWCTPQGAGGAAARRLIEIEGALLGVSTAPDGHVFVGTIVARYPLSVVMELWGGRTIRIPLAAVRGARLLDEHTWHERQVVTRRQRRGEPATIVALRSYARTKKSDTDEPDDDDE